MCGRCRGDAHHVVQATFLQAAAERGGVAVAGVRDDERDVDAPGPGLVDHVQCQLPLLHVAELRGDATGFAPGDLVRIRFGRGRVPARGEEQPPVDRRRGVVPGQVK